MLKRIKGLLAAVHPIQWLLSSGFLAHAVVDFLYAKTGWGVFDAFFFVAMVAAGSSLNGSWMFEGSRLGVAALVGALYLAGAVGFLIPTSFTNAAYAYSNVWIALTVLLAATFPGPDVLFAERALWTGRVTNTGRRALKVYLSRYECSRVGLILGWESVDDNGVWVNDDFAKFVGFEFHPWEGFGTGNFFVHLGFCSFWKGG